VKYGGHTSQQGRQKKQDGALRRQKTKGGTCCGTSKEWTQCRLGMRHPERRPESSVERIPRDKNIGSFHTGKKYKKQIGLGGDAGGVPRQERIHEYLEGGLEPAFEC